MTRPEMPVRVTVQLDEELWDELEDMIEERGMDRSKALRFALRLGFDHYKECKAIGIIGVSDMIVKGKEVWKEYRKAHAV